MTEPGLYRGATEDSFVSEAQVKRELYLRGEHPTPDFRTPLPLRKDFRDYAQQFRQRQEERGDTYTEKAEIQFFETPLVTFQADLHIGGEETDYARIEQEAELIVNTPNSFVVLLGDLVDNFSFNPPTHETLDVVPEQVKFARELVRYYHANGKLLAVWQGNHEYWTMRQGFNLYDYLMQDMDVYTFFGVAYLDAVVVDERFKICASHQFPGHSMYTTSHPQNRAYRYGSAWGADIVVSGHWHDKGINTQSFTGYGGETTNATLMALGTYKLRDGYTRNKAFPPRDPKSAYGASVILHEDTHTVQPFYDVVEAHRRFLERT